jgi:diacylglycerol kinase (ATP)
MSELKASAAKSTYTNQSRRFTLRGRLRSLRIGVRGVWLMLKSQHNAWVHAALSALAVAAGFVFRLDRREWCAIVIAMMAVWMAESLNTALEFLCDVASPEFHPLIEKAKDVSAGGVLIAAVGAAIVGLLVFGPHLLELGR